MEETDRGDKNLQKAGPFAYTFKMKNGKKRHESAKYYKGLAVRRFKTSEMR